MTRLLYVVSHTPVYSSNGYATRTHGVAKALVAAGIELMVLLKPGRPWDDKEFSGDDLGAGAQLRHMHEGVQYLTLPQPAKRQVGGGAAWHTACTAKLTEFIQVFKPTAVLAASNWDTALPAMQAASAHGLPFYYEVRGFWEYSKSSKNSAYQHSAEYTLWYAQETHLACQAQKVFTLSETMRNELIERGVARERIALIPNGVPAHEGRRSAGTASQPEPLQTQAGHPFTFGYIGSLNTYEGLDLLVAALAELQAQQVPARLVIVGSSGHYQAANEGPSVPADSQHQQLYQLACQLGVEDALELPGRVPPTQLADWYAQLDVVVMPRLAYKVCQVVPPIKPLEAAAHGKAMLTSDVAPLTEMAREAGFQTFAVGDTAALVARLQQLAQQPATRQRMGQQARLWAQHKRQFRTLVQPLLAELNLATGPEVDAMQSEQP